MKVIAVALIVTVGLFIHKTYSQQTEVITLGVFHFEFPNLDAVQIEKKDQIDVLLPEYECEIEAIAEKLTLFNPDIIIIERPVYQQHITDSLYNAYLKGDHKLSRSEDQQLGFRVAKNCNSKIYCADAWGEHTVALDALLKDEQSENYIAFEDSFKDNPDSLLYFSDDYIFKQGGILAQLRHLNNPELIKKGLGNYLIGHFKYESQEGDYTGTDFESGRWFNRNLRIFRNIQRASKDKGKRILIIFGAGHMNILNYLLECSPEYRLLDVNDYLN